MQVTGARAKWSRLVRALRRSGQSTREFAEQRGISPRSLAWWRWRLAAEAASGGSEQRLVAVDVDETPTPRDGWELSTAAGHVLRVQGTIEPDALARVLDAITRNSKRRSR